MRGTHRFFLTERSIYLLVLEDRRLDDRSVHDWLKTIRNRGGESPTIIVINKSDEGKQDLWLDERGLQETYPNIVAFLRTSCDPGDWARDSIATLRRRIVETILDDTRLRHVTDGIPAAWFAVKDQVAMRAGRSGAHPGRIRDPVPPAGTGLDPIEDENEQRALLQLLHQLGTIVAHGLARDASAARREISLLDPNWLTGAVSHSRNGQRRDQAGEFARSQLDAWLDPHRYAAARHEFVLDMMQDDPTSPLCFPPCRRPARRATWCRRRCPPTARSSAIARRTRCGSASATATCRRA